MQELVKSTDSDRFGQISLEAGLSSPIPTCMSVLSRQRNEAQFPSRRPLTQLRSDAIGTHIREFQGE